MFDCTDCRCSSASITAAGGKCPGSTPNPAPVEPSEVRQGGSSQNDPIALNGLEFDPRIGPWLGLAFCLVVWCLILSLVG
jgi:hypothetical protein